MKEVGGMFNFFKKAEIPRPIEMNVPRTSPINSRTSSISSSPNINRPISSGVSFESAAENLNNINPSTIQSLLRNFEVKSVIKNTAIGFAGTGGIFTKNFSTAWIFKRRKKCYN